MRSLSSGRVSIEIQFMNSESIFSRYCQGSGNWIEFPKSSKKIELFSQGTDDSQNLRYETLVTAEYD